MFLYSAIANSNKNNTNTNTNTSNCDNNNYNNNNTINTKKKKKKKKKKKNAWQNFISPLLFPLEITDSANHRFTPIYLKSVQSAAGQDAFEAWC